MLFETYDIGVDVRTAHLVLGLILGLVFGVAAQISRFCLRRTIAGEDGERGAAAAVWVTGFATALVTFAVASALGFVSLEDHRLASSSLPVAAVALGGLAFGVGMVLTRGCVSRLSVLSATGNLRAATVLVVFAITAHATLKGVLAPVRTAIGSVTVDLPFGTLPMLGQGVLALGAVVAAALFFRASRPSALHVVLGAVIGFVAVAGWVGTSVLLFDEFDPQPVQSAAFTLPWTDGLFWVIASSAIPAGFGVGFIAGVLSGSFLSASARGEINLQSFSSPSETLRYVAGGMLMGMGGVLAGGCTVGAGLSGSAMGSIAALIALASIVIGAYLTVRLSAMRGSVAVVA